MKANATIELLLKHIKQALIHEICAAKSSVIVVQSWFTDQDLLNELQIHAAAGRRVEVVIASEDLNGTLDLSQLIKSGGRVKSVARHKLRNTFCVLDNCTVAVGSYNWTYRGAADTFKNLFLIRN